MKILAATAYAYVIIFALTPSFSVKATGVRNLRALESEGDSAKRILLPNDPDPEPQAKLFNLASLDPTPIDTSCRATSQLELINNNENWILQSRDLSGNRKSVGGDEMYVTYADDGFASITNSTATAYVNDIGDGTYELNFVGTRQILPTNMSYAGKGTLTIFMQYTCDIGKIWPPGKEKWHSSGALYRTYKIHLDVSPVIEAPTPLKLEKDLRDYDVVLAAGDSIMTQLFCIKLRMRRENMYLHKNLGVPLHKDTLYKYISWIRSTAVPALKPFKKTALLLNTGAWDVARDNDGLVKNIYEHLQMLERLIVMARRMLPGTDIIWRSTTAMHVHRGPDIERLMYVSNSRIKALHERQVDLMNRLEVPVLDLYNYTYEQASFSKPNDAIHFMDFVHTNILDEIYPDDSIVKDSPKTILNNNIGVTCGDGMENLLTKKSLLYTATKK